MADLLSSIFSPSGYSPAPRLPAALRRLDAAQITPLDAAAARRQQLRLAWDGWLRRTVEDAHRSHGAQGAAVERAPQVNETPSHVFTVYAARASSHRRRLIVAVVVV